MPSLFLQRNISPGLTILRLYSVTIGRRMLHARVRNWTWTRERTKFGPRSSRSVITSYSSRPSNLRALAISNFISFPCFFVIPIFFIFFLSSPFYRSDETRRKSNLAPLNFIFITFSRCRTRSDDASPNQTDTRASRPLLFHDNRIRVDVYGLRLFARARIKSRHLISFTLPFSSCFSSISIEQCGWLLPFLKLRPSVLTGTVNSLGRSTFVSINRWKLAWVWKFIALRKTRRMIDEILEIFSTFPRCIEYLSESSKPIKSREPSRWQWNDSEKSLAIFKDRLFGGPRESDHSDHTFVFMKKKKTTREKLIFYTQNSNKRTHPVYYASFRNWQMFKIFRINQLFWIYIFDKG